MSKTMKTIPKLRFPEFRDEWATDELGKLGKFMGGGTPNRSIDEYWQGNIPWISSSDLNEDDIHTISVTRFINEKSITESATKLIPKGSVLFVSRVGTGKLAINHLDVCTSQDFTNFIPNKIYNYFLGYFFIANKSALTSLDQGTSIKGFSKSDLEKFKLTYPKVEEQQKIADCLSSVDELIIAQSAKVEALKAHKKALMQQLFPADGETTPRLRFPEFTNAPEWEEKKIEQVCKKPYSGGTPTTSQKEYYGGAIPFIRSAEIGKDKTELFLTELGLNNSSAKIVKKGVVLVALYGANSGDVAVSKIEGAINQAILCLDSEESNEFLYHYLTLKKNWIISTYIQGGQGNLSGDIIKSIELCFPQPNEQQKIADCLSSIDELIVAQSTKVEALKTHKKALMQQLFPTSKEM